jgi:formylglycine-generating enzyme
VEGAEHSAGISSTMSGPSILIENEIDGSLLLLVPGGEFLAGEEKFPVELPPYYLAIHPVTNAQYARFLSQQRPGHSDLQKWIALGCGCYVHKSGRGYEVYGGKDYHPVVQVSRYGVDAYFQWAGVRLPSELEWEKGARGVDGGEYPWGNEWDAGKCNFADPRFWLNRGGKTTCSVWSYPEGCGYWGHYQMSGNVGEWGMDELIYDAVRRGDSTPPRWSTAGVLRGGPYYDSPGAVRCACRLKGALPQYCTSGCGFRVARSLTL